jgi:hypothetical protein
MQQPGNTMGDGQINRNQPYNNQQPNNPLTNPYGGQQDQYSPFGNNYHGFNQFNNGFGGFNPNGQTPQGPQVNPMQNNPIFGAAQQQNLQQSNPQLYAALQGFAQKPLNSMNNLPGTTPPTMQFQQQGPIGFNSQNQQSGLGAIGSSMPNKLA